MFNNKMKVLSNKKAFTLLEIILVLSLISLAVLITMPVSIDLHYRTLLRSTAIEIREALLLAQALSLDESKEYCVEIIGGKFRVREYINGGRIVLAKKLDKNIYIPSNSHERISYNRNGETGYGKFILKNRQGKTITIDTLIGTGRVRVSDIH